MTFPDVHLVTIGERDGIVRWTWWAPGRSTPECGAHPLSRRALRLITAYANGTAGAVPGDVTAELAEVLSRPFVTMLKDAVDRPIDVLLSATGRIWHAPLLAAPLGPGSARRLFDVARVTVTPSLHLALAVTRRDQRGDAVEGGVEVYCNPQLEGAALEEATLWSVWRDIKPLDGVAQVGLHTSGRMSVLSTHADAAPGMAQALLDHHGDRLTAGECMLRTFAQTVVLGTCNGYGRAASRPGADPVGLLTVITARGARWAVAGISG